MDQNVLTTSGVTFGSANITGDLTVDTNTLIVNSTTGRVGIGMTAPSRTLDVNGDIGIASGSDLYIGSIGLNDNASTSSGASLVGLYDDSMVYVSGNTSVQSAIKQLDTALQTASTGDISAVGDAGTGSVFTGGADGGNTLWFEGTTADDYEIILTGADATLIDKTITLPDATGTVALGTGTANYVSRWTGTNTLGTGVILDNGTNVGIGSTNPSQLLSVGNQNQFTVTSGGAIAGSTINTGNGAYEIQDATALLKGLASFNTANFAVTNGDVTIKTGGVGATELSSTAVSASTYGISTNIPQITVDEDGRVTGVSDVAISYENPLTFTNGLTRTVNTIDLGGAITQDTRLYDGSYEYLFLENSDGNIGIGTTAPTDKLHVLGNVFATGGFHVGSDSTGNLISTASAGASSTTLYIGNESILASGDIGSSVQGYDQQLADVAGLTPADGSIIIGNGTNFITESGNTARTSLGVGLSDSPSFTGVTLSGLTPSRLVATDGSRNSSSVADLTSWIAGTSNRVSVTSDGDGTITTSLPNSVYLGTSGQIGRDSTDLIDFSTDNTINIQSKQRKRTNINRQQHYIQQQIKVWI